MDLETKQALVAEGLKYYSPPLNITFESFGDKSDWQDPPLIHGLLRECEIMNIIASPKAGKSWLAIDLALSVASGQSWLGKFPVEKGIVVHMDIELNDNTLFERYRQVCKAKGLNSCRDIRNIFPVPLRGFEFDINDLNTEVMCEVKEKTVSLIIIDPFYRLLPKGVSENDNSEIAKVYDKVESLAQKFGCSIALVHHSSKGNQARKAVTDVGSGAGSFSRAADTHLVIREHQEENVYVVDSSLRSWPPIKPLALSWKWPLFTPIDTVDATRLKGLAPRRQKKEKKHIPSLDEFIEACIEPFEPCCRSTINTEAKAKLDLSDRMIDQLVKTALDQKLIVKGSLSGEGVKFCKTHREGKCSDQKQFAAALLLKGYSDIKELANMTNLTSKTMYNLRNEMIAEGLIDLEKPEKSRNSEDKKS